MSVFVLSFCVHVLKPVWGALTDLVMEMETAMVTGLEEGTGSAAVTTVTKGSSA